MAVYVDILVAVNFIVDYFLLLLSAKFLRKNPPILKLVAASGLAAMSSLVIFLPPLNAVTEIVLRVVICAAVTLVAFGFANVRTFLRAALVFFAVSFGFAGAMMAFWLCFKPRGMVIHNSAVYLDVSPLFLVGFSCVGYLLTALFRKIFSKNAQTSSECEVTLFYKEKSLRLHAIVDSGNSLEDIFGAGEVIVVEPGVLDKISGDDETGRHSRFRAVPCSGAVGTGILSGFRCDRALVEVGTQKFFLPSPIAAEAKVTLGGDYNAIINPRSIN